MRGVFVTGTDTDAGKTLVCATLMTGAPQDWRYWKPVQTGLATDPGDTATVRRLAAVSPDCAPDTGIRLQPPVSPHHAAALAGQTLGLEAVVAAAPLALAGAGFAVVEGAGGLLVPLNDCATMLDLMRALQLPVVVTVRVKLGAINHALLTERVLLASGVPALGFVLSGEADPSLLTALAAHARLPVLGRLPQLEPGASLLDHGARLRQAIVERMP